ncbi:hypothetical protein VP01_1380g10 [Puccinia sorghi]|uniref:Uncharacterized protein n=1 Tax=Puccinia sorghi TaxID=27349 RepID=A0A0L6VM05_9BASI|nr:hypothetical protein VP01_1380g10 [Puccinia sorghi]
MLCGERISWPSPSLTYQGWSCKSPAELCCHNTQLRWTILILQSWKMLILRLRQIVRNTPTSWNKPQLIELQANFVHCCGLDLKRTVVFVDEAGFDLHSGRAFGYAPQGNDISSY